jgi:hypothetical protein
MQQGEKQKRLRKLRLLLLLHAMWMCAYLCGCTARLPAHAGGSFAQGTGVSHMAVDSVSCFSSCPCRLGLAARPNQIGCGIRSPRPDLNLRKDHHQFLILPCQLQPWYQPSAICLLVLQGTVLGRGRIPVARPLQRIRSRRSSVPVKSEYNAC